MRLILDIATNYFKVVACGRGKVTVGPQFATLPPIELLKNCLRIGVTPKRTSCILLNAPHHLPHANVRFAQSNKQMYMVTLINSNLNDVEV